jgi:TPR repeat protein
VEHPVGFCLRQGIGFKSHRLRSVKSFKEAADQGDAVAQFNYGLCYRAEGLLTDFTEACEYFKLSADQSFMPGSHATAFCLVNHRIDYGGFSSLSSYGGPARDLSESEESEETWQEYQRAVHRIRLGSIDRRKLTKTLNLSVSRTLNLENERSSDPK